MNPRSIVVFRSILRTFLVPMVAGAVIAGCSEKAPTEPSPPPVAPTVTAITVSGPGSGQQGATAAFIATAQMSNGTTQTVTTQATWQSSNSDVAPVSSTGVVTYQSVGEAEIRATFSNVTGTLRVTVTGRAPNSYTLIGIVTETTSRAAVNGARVEVLNGPNASRTTTTDGNGFYSMQLLEGTFNVRFTRADYETRERSITLTSDARVDVTMTSTLPPPPDVTRYYGTYSIRLSGSSQGCSEPVVVGPTGTLELGGRADGSRTTATITERGQVRSYNGSMSEDGGFGGTGSGLIGLRTPQPHEFSGSLGARVSGNSVSGSENLRFAAPCPGGSISISFSGSR